MHLHTSKKMPCRLLVYRTSAVLQYVIYDEKSPDLKPAPYRVHTSLLASFAADPPLGTFSSSI